MIRYGSVVLTAFCMCKEQTNLENRTTTTTTKTRKQKNTRRGIERKRRSMTTHKIRYDSHLDIDILALVLFMSSDFALCTYLWMARRQTSIISTSNSGSTTLAFQIEGEHLTATHRFQNLLNKRSRRRCVLHKRRKSIEFEMNNPNKVCRGLEMITHTHIRSLKRTHQAREKKGSEQLKQNPH